MKPRLATGSVTRSRLRLAARSAALFLAALVTSETVSAIDVRPPHLAQMIGFSDLVASGTITEVREQSFVVQVDAILAGSPPDGPLVVGRPRRWPDEPRWAPYAPDQRVVLFLARASSSAAKCGPKWWIDGPVGRGELPIEGEFVYLPERYEGLGELELARVHGAEVEFQKIEFTQFLAAVSAYSECFGWRDGGQESPSEVTQVCDDATLDKYGSRSALHLHLAEDSRALASRHCEQ